MLTLPQSTLVIASHNPGKIQDIVDIFAPFNLKILSAAALNLPEPEETEDTFAGNARLKAEAAVAQCGLPVLADDSGVVIPALGGAPGVHTARWAGPTRDFTLAMKRVEAEMALHQDRRACFTSVLALSIPGQQTQIYEGNLWGSLAFPPRGTKGYGYCPIFIPDGYDITLGEMEPDERNAISHRRKAIDQLLEHLRAS